ncbi:MAG: magnesium transporter, partial [Clostridia bacterium]|nr:magnesium transporter [Clostridia bacterium]
MLVLFRLLSKEAAAEVFVELDTEHQEELIKSYTDAELRGILDEMYLDDTVDIVEEMPASVVKRILKVADPAMRQQINDMLKYSKDSVGSIMTVEYVSLKKTMTVAEAFDR